MRTLLAASSLFLASLATVPSAAFAQTFTNALAAELFAPTAMITPSASDPTSTVSIVIATAAFTGHVRTAKGPLPGAVVRLGNTDQHAVTDADGRFQLTVLATGEPVTITASYAGFADETVVLDAAETNASVQLFTPKVIKVARKNRLKTYMRTAHRQLRRDMRKHVGHA